MQSSNDNPFGSESAVAGDFHGGSQNDIVLNNGSRNSSKKPLIIGALVGLVIVIFGVCGYFVAISIINGNLAKSTGFDDLVAYLTFGESDNGEQKEDGNLIYAVKIGIDDKKAVSDYYEALRGKVQGFMDKARGKINDGLLEEYGDSIRVLSNAIDYYNLSKKLSEIYLNDGSDAAWKYYDEQLSCKGNGPFGPICEKENEYYKSLLENYKFYVDSGCYFAGVRNAHCAKKYYGEQEFAEMMDKYVPDYVFDSYIFSSGTRTALSDAVKELNRKMQMELNNA